MILEFSLIFNEETAFSKKVFNSSAISLLFYSPSSFSTSFMLPSKLSLFEKNGLTLLQNNLLSLTKEGFSLFMIFFVPFCKAFYNNFCFLYTLKAQRLLRSFFEINIFQLGPSRYVFLHRRRHI